MRFSRFLIFLALLIAALGGWFAGRMLPRHAAPAASERRPLFYQSPMHPWIKSEQPGNCTICGMKLVPVFEGEAASQSGGDDELVKLSPQGIDVLRVASAAVTRQPLRRTLHVAGRIDDDDSRHRRLSASVEGRIEKLFVNSVGAEVTQGQPLLGFFSRELLAARDEYALALKQPSSSARDLALAASRAKLRRFGLAPEQIEALATQTGDIIELLAPISGTVVERKVYEGQYVKEGDVLFEIADFSQMWFVADVYERDLAWVRVGQMVEVSTPTVPGRTYRAPIAFIDPNVVENTRTARIRVVLENPHIGDPAKHQHELLHRVFASGAIAVETPPVLTVPRTAVLAAGAEPLVYVVKSDGAYEPRAVTLGRVGDDFYEVMAGLEEGERVVTNGNLLIDAQAQLNRGGEPPKKPAFTAVSPQLTRQVAGLAERLAADDLAGFNELAPAANLSPAPDLALARKAFHPLAEAVATWAAEARRNEPKLAALKIYRCPMTADAFPGAPAKASWVQLAPPLRNPYFGHAMLECGDEVRP